jgi:hypothetical protein
VDTIDENYFIFSEFRLTLFFFCCMVFMYILKEWGENPLLARNCKGAEGIAGTGTSGASAKPFRSRPPQTATGVCREG